MRVLALDLASSTGVAFGVAGGKPQAGAVHLGATEAQRYAKAISLTCGLIAKWSPDLVTVEAPVGGAKASAFLIGLVACVTGEATRLKVPVKAYFPATVRKHFLGKALTARDFPGKNHAAAKKAIKGAVMARCHLLGWEAPNGDCADALALWDYACAMESRSHQVTSLPGLFQGAK